MQMRTTQPYNNPYYIRKANGGYSNAIKGTPTIKGANVLCNCVGYANGRFGEIQDLGYIKYQLVCNAENFIEKAKSMGLEISAVPVVGGIMVWQKGRSLSGNDGAGHVAVVEKVISANQIITSESGYNAWAFKTVNRSNSNGRWGQSSAYKFRGCIVNPAVGRKGAEEIKSVDVDGKWGTMTTLLSQKLLSTYMDGVVSGQRTACKKYLPNALTTSWEFSKNGSGSALIKAIQKLVGTTADGIAGEGTVKAMQTFLKAQGYYTGSVDGIMGSGTVKAWQKWLNSGGKKKEPAPDKVDPKPAVELPTLSLAKSNAEVIADTIKWAKWIAGDNSFHYGHGKEAHHNGCFFCGTQPASKRKAGIKDWQRTYCCNPFVGASWAHGGCDQTALKMCRKGTSWDFNKGRGYDASKLFKNLGKPNQSELKAGDVLCSDKHVALYIGNGQVAEAGGGDDNVPNSKSWNNSIRVRKLSYGGFKRVHRYIGSVNAKNVPIRHGELSYRVKQWQRFLNVYNGKTVVAEDGIFGDGTLKYTKAFQTASKIAVDGIVGSGTLASAQKSLQ